MNRYCILRRYLFPSLLIIIVASILIYPQLSQAQTNPPMAKFVADVIEAKEPIYILAKVVTVLEDSTGKLKKDDKVIIDAPLGIDNSDIDWPLKYGDAIEVYGVAGPDASGGIGIWVGKLPQYLRLGYRLSVSIVPPEGGSVNPSSGVYGKNTVVKLTETPNPGWKFIRWDGDTQGKETSTTIKMNSNKNVVAVFNKQNGGSNTDWRKEIQPGDILLHRGEGGPALFCDWINCYIYWTHAGIYVGDNLVVESRNLLGVKAYSITDWDYPNDRWVKLIRVNTDSKTKEKAVKWAKDLADNLKNVTTYDIELCFLKNWAGKAYNSSDTLWYCSELVWAAYYNNGVDLGWNSIVNKDEQYFTYAIAPGPGLIYKTVDETTCEKNGKKYKCGRVKYCPPEIDQYRGVGFTDILRDDDIIDNGYGHQEGEVPCGCSKDDQIRFEAYCPVDITVTDPNKRIASRTIREIPYSMYISFDRNQDSSPDPVLGIGRREIGTYLVKVTPKPDANPDDTYSLRVISGDKFIFLAENIPVSQIPKEPYEVKSTPSGIEPGDDGDGDRSSTFAWFKDNWPFILLLLILIGLVYYGFRSRKQKPVAQKVSVISKKKESVQTQNTVLSWLTKNPLLAILCIIFIFIILFVPLFTVSKSVEVTETILSTVTKQKPETIQSEEKVKVYTGWIEDKSKNVYKLNVSDEIVEVKYVRVPDNLWDISIIDVNGGERIFRDIAKYDITKTSSITVPKTVTRTVTYTETIPEKIKKNVDIKLRVNLVQLIFGAY